MRIPQVEVPTIPDHRKKPVDVRGRSDLVRDALLQGFFIVLVSLLALLTLLPLYWMFATSIKMPETVGQLVPDLIPSELSFLSWRRIFEHPMLVRWFLNTTIVAGTATAATVLVSALAGYVFAKMTFPGRRLFFWLVLLTMMLPSQASLVPSYALMLRLDWIDTFWPLIIPSLGSAYGVFLLKQYMQRLPSSLVDAARLDGCSELKIFWRIILPLAKPGLAVLTIFTFVGHWNSFIGPLLYLRRPELYTLQVGLADMRASVLDMQFVMAAAGFTAIPMIVVFLIFQRYFMHGLTIGGVKG